MKRLPDVPLCVLFIGLAFLVPIFAKPPVELQKVASIKDLTALAKEQVESIAEQSETEEKYALTKEEIRREAGVLAVLAQATLEHPDRKTQKMSPLALRDAALKLAKSKTYEGVKSALPQLRAAAGGEGASEKFAEVAWKDLIEMDDLMHVVNAKNSRIRRAARRSRDPEADSRNAALVAVLSLSMAEKTDQLSGADEKTAWKKYALDFQKGMTDLAAAFKAKDKAAIEKHLAFATKACNDCHAHFRDGE